MDGLTKIFLFPLLTPTLLNSVSNYFSALTDLQLRLSSVTCVSYQAMNVLPKEVGRPTAKH